MLDNNNVCKLDFGAATLEDLGIGFPFLLKVAEHEIEVMAERREARELGVPLDDFEKEFPDPIDAEAEEAKQKLLGEIHRLAPLLPPRGRNYTKGYLLLHFPDLVALFSGPIDLSNDRTWARKTDEIIELALSEPDWPIILGRLYATFVFLDHALKVGHPCDLFTPAILD